MNHQELRDAIRNLMKANDSETSDLESVMRKGLISDPHTRGMRDGRYFAIYEQNKKLQAILDAHK